MSSSTIDPPQKSASSPRPPLTRAQRRDRTARAMAAAAQTHSSSRRRELLDYVVSINMEVARGIARRYFRRGVEEDDLVQVAYAALTRAARDFDPSRHHDFLSYVVPTIRGELKKHFRDRGWTVRPPRRIQESQARITSAEGELAQRMGRSPRPSEIADHLGIDVDEVVEAISADGCFAPASLDRPAAGLDGGGPTTMGDLIGQEDPAQPAAEARVVLAPAVRLLTERDRRILYMRFFEDRTQQEIAEDIGVTQMQVSRLLTRILRDLRTELTASADLGEVRCPSRPSGAAPPGHRVKAASTQSWSPADAGGD
jgi:RNA polymerase sigma-B factor